MAELIKYVSLENLTRYDELIKEYINKQISPIEEATKNSFKTVALDGNKLQFFTEAPAEEETLVPAFEIELPVDSTEEIAEIQEKLQELENKISDIGTNEDITAAIEAAFERITEDVESKIANALSSVFTYKGMVDTEEALHEIDEAKVGDVWIVKEDNSEYIFTANEEGGYWEKFGSTIDLSSYATVHALTDEKLRAINAERTLAERISTLESDKLDLEPISNEEIDQLFDGTPTDIEDEVTD